MTLNSFSPSRPPSSHLHIGSPHCIDTRGGFASTNPVDQIRGSLDHSARTRARRMPHHVQDVKKIPLAIYSLAVCTFCRKDVCVVCPFYFPFFGFPFSEIAILPAQLNSFQTQIVILFNSKINLIPFLVPFFALFYYRCANLKLSRLENAQVIGLSGSLGE